MHIAFAIFATILCAFANRFRGGGLILLPGETVTPDHKRDTIRRATWAVMCGLVAWNPAIPFVMFATVLPGWGSPIGAATGKVKNKIKEWAWLDFVARTIATGIRSQGLVWLSIFGLLSGALAWGVSGNVWPFLWVSMGLAYWMTRDIEHGEYAYGALQGLTLAMWVFRHG